MSDAEPLKRMDYMPTADGQYLVWRTETFDGVERKFSFPTKQLGKMILSLIKINVHPEVSKHAEPLPAQADYEMAIGESLIPHSIVPVVIPGRANVGLEIDLPGSLRILLEFPKEYGKELGDNLLRAAAEAEAIHRPKH